MTVRELKELLNQFDDEDIMWVSDGYLSVRPKDAFDNKVQHNKFTIVMDEHNVGFYPNGYTKED